MHTYSIVLWPLLLLLQDSVSIEQQTVIFCRFAWKGIKENNFNYESNIKISFPGTVCVASGYYLCVSVIFPYKGQGKVNFFSVGSSPLFLFRNGDKDEADINWTLATATWR